MPPKLLTTEDAAQMLGIATGTLYAWLSQSDSGAFTIRGQSLTIAYFQGGRRGQGRIRIAENEILRILATMQVTPKGAREPKGTNKTLELTHITTKLGRPDD